MVKGPVVGSPIRGNQPHDIFKADDLGRFLHLIDDTEPFPKHATATGFDALHPASEREILAREARPREIAKWNRAACDLANIGELEGPVMVRLVDSRFPLRDIIAPDNFR